MKIRNSRSVVKQQLSGVRPGGTPTKEGRIGALVIVDPRCPTSSFQPSLLSPSLSFIDSFRQCSDYSSLSNSFLSCSFQLVSYGHTLEFWIDSLAFDPITSTSRTSATDLPSPLTTESFLLASVLLWRFDNLSWHIQHFNLLPYSTYCLIHLLSTAGQ